MLGEDKHHGGPNWWLPQSTSLPFYKISNEYDNIGAWLPSNHTTHELSSGKLESSVADIGGSEEGKIYDRREKSRKRVKTSSIFIT